MNIEQERNIKIAEQEYKTIQRFTKEFSKNIVAIEVPENIYSSYDLNLTGLTENKNNIFKFEFKVRNYSCEYLSGSTWIETTKYNELKKIWLKDKNIQFRYFNYTTDGYLSFNLNKRFEKDDNTTATATANNCTYCSTYEKKKEMIVLTIDEKIDKIKIY